MLGSRCRWAMELCPPTVKQPLGVEEGAPSGLAAVMSHVPWVYGASIVLSLSPPGVSAEVTRLGDAQRQLQPCLAHQEQRRILQKLTQIGGVPR
jgi:hypothetical protein